MAVSTSTGRATPRAPTEPGRDVAPPREPDGGIPMASASAPRRSPTDGLLEGSLAGCLASLGPVLSALDGHLHARVGVALVLACTLAGALLAAATRRSILATALALPALAAPALASAHRFGWTTGLVAGALVPPAVASVAGPGSTWPRRSTRPMVWVLPATLLVGAVWAGTSSVATSALAAAPAGIVGLAYLTGWAPLVAADRATLDALDRFDALVQRIARRTGATGRLLAARALGARRDLRAAGGMREVAGTAGAAAIAAAWTAPMFHHLVQHPTEPVMGVSDFAFHLELARDMSLWPFHLTMPHPVFHLAVRALDPVLGLAASPVVLLSLSCAVAAAVLVRFAREGAHGRDPLGPVAAALFAVGFFASESPVVLLQWIGLADPAPFAPVHLWGSPTETVALATALVLLPLLVRVTSGPGTTPASYRRAPTWSLATAVVVATLAKPAMTIVLVPGIALHLVVTGRWTGRTVRHLALWFALPAIAVTGWQTWFLETGQSPRLRTGFTIDPFALLDTTYRWGEGGALFWTAVLVVAAAIVVGRRRFVGEPIVSLTLCAMLFAVALLLLMRETGERALHGNLAKPAYHCWVVLWILAGRFWLVELRDALRSGDPAARRRAAGIAAAATVVLVSGVLAHLEATGVMTLPDAWT